MAQWIDWFVFTKKAALMQRLADYVRTGHRWYVCGEIPPEKAGYLAAKFDALYGVGMTHMQQYRRRKAGQASFRLLMLHLEYSGDFLYPHNSNLYWWLLRTDGELPPEARKEKWRDALEDRITLTGYELVRYTRPGAAKPVWTWRMTEYAEQVCRARIRYAVCKGREDILQGVIYDKWHAAPGFAGIRKQVKKMRALILSDWRRSGRKFPRPEIPTRIGYVRRLPDLGRKLSELGVKKRAARRQKDLGGAGLRTTEAQSTTAAQH